MIACQQQEELRAEVVLIWLYQRIKQQPEDAADAVLLAALVLEEACAG